MQYLLIAVILGLVEGITEFIPVSSTGHLLIAEHFLHVKEKVPFFTTEVFNSFIQVWAMIAALPLFKDRLATLREPRGRGYLAKLVVALGITVAGVLAFRAVMKRYPDAGDEITDCLSGDVNKDFSRLWSRIREFVPLPEDLPYGEPLPETKVQSPKSKV